MAEIRQYRKEKQNRTTTEKEIDYNDRIRMHKQKMRLIGIVIVVALIILIFVLCLVKHNSSYSDYSIQAESRRNDSEYSQFEKFGSGYIRCSRDGVAEFSYGGEQIWNKSFEISNISVKINKNHFAVADINGNNIYVFNTEGYIGTINTALPIIQMSISQDGLVVAILEDAEVDYINMYNCDGEKIYSVKTTVYDTGVPISACVSDDGEKLVVSFAAVKGSNLKSSVVFYNFGTVGQNVNERIVGGYDTDELVPEVEFVNSDTAVAFAENNFSIYGVKEYPKLISTVELDNEIKKVFYSSGYVGIVYNDAARDGSLYMDIYDLQGTKVLSHKVEEDFTNYKFVEDNVLMYNSSNCVLLNVKGKIIFKYTFENEIVNLIPISGKDSYLYINSDKIIKIKLK